MNALANFNLGVLKLTVCFFIMEVIGFFFEGGYILELMACVGLYLQVLSKLYL